MLRSLLPDDAAQALLVGRVWRPGVGPAVVALRGDRLVDLSRLAPTLSALLERPDAAQLAAEAQGEVLPTGIEALLGNSLREPPDPALPHLLAPCDLQAVKAAGVTFAVSLLERVIEEQARGNAAAAGALRAELRQRIGSDLSGVRPGSLQALQLKRELQARGAWSQYLEVGLGPYAEIFTKAQPMSAVGLGTAVGLHPASHWNNPEPELVLAVNSRAEILGATLGNDVNLRDIEGRSALLLGKAKDNNASCAIGPFLRLFDARFTLDDVRSAQISLRIDGVDDGFVLEGSSRMAEISRDPLELVAQTCGAHHQYPDGFMLFLGTLFSPVQDRDQPGGGFTHHLGDRVSIRSPRLGCLVNPVHRSDELPPWTFGTGALMANLAQRGLLS